MQCISDLQTKAYFHLEVDSQITSGIVLSAPMLAVRKLSAGIYQGIPSVDSILKEAKPLPFAAAFANPFESFFLRGYGC